MLDFVTAEEASMDDFLSVSQGSPYQEQLRDYAETLIRERFTKPEWCVLGLEAGVPLVRAALWSLPGQAVPTDTVMIEVDWSAEDLAAGHALLTNMHERASGLGADALSHSVDSPPAAPQYQEDEVARVRLLEESSYELLRDGLRWRYASSEEAQPEPSLVFRPLAEVGEEAFVDAIASTYEGTRDSWLTRNIEERGLRGAAQEDFNDLEDMEHKPEWWELAYTSDGTLAGVSMAARNPTAAVVAYVGVMPEQRGRGLAPELVRRSTQQLLESGADEIRGDCDRDNIGMVKGFERAGFEQFARRRTYRRALAS